MEQFEDLNQFIAEAARRALSDSDLGHVVVSDSTAGARFFGSLPWEDNYNSGDYLGVNTFSMRPGDSFGVMLVPNGTVQEVFANPATDGAARPLFSLSSSNPNDAFHVGQIADVTGDGNTFVMEDLRVDDFSDKDYNDIIFQVRGATGSAVKLDEVISSNPDWRTTDLGQALINYATPYVNLPTVSDSEVLPTVDSEGVVPPLTEVDGVWTPVEEVTSGNSLPVSSEPLVTLPVDSDFDPMVTQPGGSEPIQFDFPVANQPLIGVIDTGFSENNPDIDYSRIILGSDRISNDNNPLLQPGEGSEHGTHVLGIIGATQNNGIGIDGVNDKAPIWVGRAVDSGKWAESLVEFVDAAKASGKPNAVVNLSLDLTQVNPDGSVTTRYEFTPQERAAIEYARQNQVLIVVAAGNDGDVMSILGQASQEFDNIITVGAADGLDRAAYSSYGYGLDILARGGTTENPVLSTAGNDVGTMAGTSVAAAHVTGAVSQVWAANPQLSYRQVIDTLKRTATDLNLPGWDAETGAGLLNLAAAVFLAKMLVPEDNATPAIDIPSTWSGEGKVTPTERAAAEIYPSNFSGTVRSVGVNTMVRSGPGTNYAIVGQRSPGAVVNFDAWTRGQFISYPELGTADDRWYRIAGTQNQWISAALIAGGPSSTPTPQPQPQPGRSYYPELASLTDAQWNEYTKDNTRFDVGWPDYRDERSLTPLPIRNIYTDLSNAVFGRRYPATAGYLLDPGYRNGIGLWHSGFDLAAPQRTPVKAVVGGTIVRGIQEKGGDYFIGVRGDDGKLWIYGHLGSVAVPGGRIEAGQVIGNIGSEGHLHLEVQRGPNYRKSYSSNLDVVRNATLNPIKSFWELTNRNSGGGSLPPTQPSGRRPYIIKSGDTLSGIAQRELGNGNRWREITKADGGTFTDAEARRLQVGQTVYLPVTYSTGNGTPVPSVSVQPADFAKALAFVLRWEGGYSNHPSDPGGATNKGITQNTYNAYRTSKGLAAQDVRLITQQEVEDIYFTRYWKASGSDQLTSRLAMVHFDTAVNMGVGGASSLLQQARQSSNGDEMSVVRRYLDLREARYRAIVANSPSMGVFLQGWLNRLNDLRRAVEAMGGSNTTPSPSPTPGANGNINWVNFSGTVGPSVGVNLRNSTRFSDRSPSNEPYNKRLEFDGWTYGETVTDLWLGTPDARWFKVKGKNFWVPSAYIYGNPPNSSPMPGGAVGNVEIIAEPIDSPSDPDGTLGTAGNWGVFSDRTETKPNFIGYNGDQNDFIRFSVANNRTNVNLRLSGLSADADLQLIRDLNNNGRVDPGEVLGKSLNPGTSVDSVSRILDSGDYFIRVLPGTSSAKTSYKLELNAVNLRGQIQNNRPNNNAVDFYRYTSSNDNVFGTTNIGIESGKDTIVVVHGRGDNSQGSNIQALLKAATQRYPNHQVLALDWRKPAEDDGQPPLTAARSIAPVANWAKNVLAKIGLTSERISLFGHSLGSYVSGEIGKLFGKVENLVAIDPAFPGILYDIDENQPLHQGITDFQNTAKNSLAFVVKDAPTHLGGLAGDAHSANRAHNSLVIKYEGDFVSKKGWHPIRNAKEYVIERAAEEHNTAVNVVADAVSKGYLRLENNLALPSDIWKDKYGDSGNYVKWTGTHEGRVTATREGKIQELAYINGSSRGRDIETNNWDWG
ncbi:MAG: S8 family serine peptidase [Cyanobacteriota bacterium]